MNVLNVRLILGKADRLQAWQLLQIYINTTKARRKSSIVPCSFTTW